MDDMKSTPAELLDVVVATDGSADADLAVDWAAEEAMRRSASLLILSACGLHPEAGDPGSGTLDIVDRAADRVRRHFPGIQVETKVVQGDPRDALEEYQDRASLVVLGSRGTNALRTVWLGSVTSWATRHLHVPTVIVRPLAGAGQRSVGGIAVGVDGGDPDSALRVAFEMAAHRRIPLTIGHAWWDVESPDARWRSVDPAAVEAERSRFVRDVVERVAPDFPDVTFTLAFGRGSVVAFLLDLARTRDALVIGRRPSAPFDARGLGTIASAVVEHARGVTVVVPETAPTSKGGRR